MCACELASFWQENVKGVSIRVLAKMAETSYRRFDVLYHFAIGRGGGDGGGDGGGGGGGDGDEGGGGDGDEGGGGDGDEGGDGDGGGDVLLGSQKPWPIPHLVQLNFSTLYTRLNPIAESLFCRNN